MSSPSSNKNGVHLLVFPYPAQGHMLPLLDLTHQLSLNSDLTITILITPKNLPILSPILSANPSIQTLVLPFPNHPSIPPGVENIKDVGNHANIAMIFALSQLQGQIIQWFQSHSNPPVAILSDFFLGWTYHLGQNLGIPRIVFYCCAAFATAALESLWENADDRIPGEVVTFQDLPWAPNFTWEEAPSVFRRYREAESRVEVVRDSMLANCLSWGFVFNTFEAFEGEFLKHWRKKIGHSRLYGVGPINLLNRADEGKLSDGGNVMSWLDGCDDGAVLYVCFGSQKILTTAQIEALAIALETSRVRFVWVVRVADGYGKVPDRFEDRVKGRGLVIKGWAQQMQILSHRAVGGFLSHCGWNSVMEAVAAGVMIFCWPMEAEQYFDAKQLVEYKECAYKVCEGGDTVPDSTELAQLINELMKVDVAERIRAKTLKDEALEAVKSAGSSGRDLDKFVKQLELLQVERV